MMNMLPQVFLLAITFAIFSSSSMSLDDHTKGTPTAGAPPLKHKRQVQLHLESVHASAVTLATITTLSEIYPSDALGQDREVPLIEIFQVPIDAIGLHRLTELKAGSVNASVTPIAPFRIRDEISGEIVSTSSYTTLARQLNSESGPPTLCGGTIARGMMLISFDGESAVSSETKYTPVDMSVAGPDSMYDGLSQRMLIESSKQRHLNDKDEDICEKIDAVFSPGGCLQEATCFIKFTRKKRVEKEVCLGASKCGKRVKGKITVKSSTEFDEDYFEGECRTIVIPRWFDDCECFLTGAGKQALNSWRKQPLPSIQCTTTKCTGQGSGDPHFTTWDGTRFSYHGECDMVMAQSKFFGEGLGLDLHIRTTIQDSFSYISSVALKIGSDVLEVSANATHVFNFDPMESLPASISGFPLRKKHKMMACASEGPCPIRTVYKIDLGLGEEITLAAFKGILKVEVNAVLSDAVGLTGTLGKPGMVARDGQTILTPDEMGQEWQVQPGDPLLFHTERNPQFPQTCTLPTESSTRRLGEDAALLQLGESSCAGVADTEMKASCMFDVQNTGDADLALEYLLE